MSRASSVARWASTILGLYLPTLTDNTMACGYQAKTASVKTKLAQTEATCADCTTQLRARQAQASQLGQELEAAATAVSDRKRQIQAAQRERRALEASVEQLLQSSTSLKSRQSALQAEIHETQVRCMFA